MNTPNAIQKSTATETTGREWLNSPLATFMVPLLLCLIICAISIASFPIWLPLAGNHLNFLKDFLNDRRPEVLFVRWMETLMCGVALFALRKIERRHYGAGELLVGAVVCWAAIHATHASAVAASAAMAGGMYMIVRGLDNFEQGQNTARERKAKAVSPNVPAVPKFETTQPRHFNQSKDS